MKTDNIECQVTPTDNYFWIAVYVDGSYDIEELPSNFSKIKFKQLDHFTLWPKEGTEPRTAISIKKHPDYILIFRKQRHVGMLTGYKGSDYMLGLEPDDKKKKTRDIQRGKVDPYELNSKKSPNGFRIWLTKEGEIKTASSFKRTEEFKDGVRYITCEIN
jgi:hypothetical protein